MRKNNLRITIKLENQEKSDVGYATYDIGKGSAGNKRFF